MGKNLAATWFMLIKGVRSCQIYNQLLDLCHLTNTKLVFFQVSLLKVKIYLNRRLFMRTICLWHKIQQLQAKKIDKIA